MSATQNTVTRERKFGPYSWFYLALQVLVILGLGFYYLYTMSVKYESIIPRADKIINSANSTKLLLAKN